MFAQKGAWCKWRLAYTRVCFGAQPSQNSPTTVVHEVINSYSSNSNKVLVVTGYFCWLLLLVRGALFGIGMLGKTMASFTLGIFRHQ